MSLSFDYKTLSPLNKKENKQFLSPVNKKRISNPRSSKIVRESMSPSRHSDRYKTKFCHFFGKDVSKCSYGELCSFAHSCKDIQVRLLHYLVADNSSCEFFMTYFKTEWCPFNFEHNKA